MKMIENIKQNPYRTLFKLSLFLFSTCFFAQLFISNKYAVKTGELNQILCNKRSLDQEITGLEYRDSILSSLERVRKTAIELGFVNTESSILTIGPVVVASLPDNRP
jgi:hypothetical protein